MFGTTDGLKLPMRYGVPVADRPSFKYHPTGIGARCVTRARSSRFPKAENKPVWRCGRRQMGPHVTLRTLSFRMASQTLH
jgi:succinate dehydrogenase/fumarate reductase flavoprotein subunit